MKPGGYTHRESGDNLLLGVALLEAWRDRDQHSFAALLHAEDGDLYGVAVAVCRAAEQVAHYLTDRNDDAIDEAVEYARSYGLFRRDDLGGDDILNRSNKKG